MTARLRKAHQPLGHRADGTAFWSYFGSAGPDDDGNDDGGGQGGSDDGDDDDDSDGEGEDDDKIGEDGLTGKGRRAIQSERASAQKVRDRLKPLNALMRKYGAKNAAELEAMLEGRTKSKGTKQDEDDRPDPDEIRRQATAEAQTKVNDKLIRSAVRGVAAELLNDPRDAARFLDLSDYEVDDDGDVDENQIRRDLRALLADKPYLGKSKKGDGRQGGSPDFEGGTRKTSRGGGMNEFIRSAAGVTGRRR